MMRSLDTLALLSGYRGSLNFREALFGLHNRLHENRTPKCYIS